MDEKTATRALCRAIEKHLPGVVIFKHFDVSTDGIPDLSITWGHRTMWVEVKYREGEVREAQVVTMRRLAWAGLAIYVRYEDNGDHNITTVTNPKYSDKMIAEFNGHDHRMVAELIRAAMLRGEV